MPEPESIHNRKPIRRRIVSSDPRRNSRLQEDARTLDASIDVEPVTPKNQYVPVEASAEGTPDDLLIHAEGRIRRTEFGVRLTKKDAQQIIEAHGLPPVMTLDEAATYARLSKGTIQNQVVKGRYVRSALTGRPLQFLTLYFIQDHAARGGGRA